MGRCANCTNTQARLNPGNLCKHCFESTKLSTNTSSRSHAPSPTQIRPTTHSTTNHRMAAPTNINNQVRFSPQPLMQQHSQQPRSERRSQGNLTNIVFLQLFTFMVFMGPVATYRITALVVDIDTEVDLIALRILHGLGF